MGVMPHTHVLRTGVRIVLNGGGELFRFGTDSVPVKDDVIEYVPLVGSPVQYEVKSTKYVVREQASNLSDDYSSYSQVTVELL